MVDCAIHIRHILHDQRVVAAHFQRQDFLRLATELLVQQVPDGGTAGKEQAVDQRMTGQGFSGRRGALHQVDHAIGNAGFFPELNGQLGNPGRQLTGLEHHGIARQQGRHNVAIGQMPREVVGPKHSHYAMGPVPQHRMAAGNV